MGSTAANSNRSAAPWRVRLVMAVALVLLGLTACANSRVTVADTADTAETGEPAAQPAPHQDDAATGGANAGDTGEAGAGEGDALPPSDVRVALDPPAVLGRSRIEPLAGDELQKAGLSLKAALAGLEAPDYLAEADQGAEDAGDNGAAPAPAPSREAVKLYAAARDAAFAAKWAEALKLIDQVIDLDGASASPHALRGEVFVALNDAQRAREAMIAALRRDADLPEPLLVVGRLAFDDDAYDHAAVLLDRAIQSDRPVDPGAMYLAGYYLGNALLQLGYDRAADQALAAYLREPERFSRSTRLFRQVMLIGRRRPLVQLQLGDASMRLGQIAAAVAYYEQAAGSQRIPSLALAARRVYALMLLGRFEQAEQLAVDTLAANAESNAARQLFQYVAEHTDNRPRLIRRLEQAYRDADESEDLAVAIADAGQADQAVDLLVDHLQRHPDNTEVLGELARRVDAEQLPRVLAIGLKRIAAEPGRAHAVSDALLERDATSRDWRTAIRDLPEALQQSTAAAFFRGRLLERAGRDRDAEQAYVDAADGEPAIAAGRVRAARTARRIGEGAEPSTAAEANRRLIERHEATDAEALNDDLHAAYVAALIDVGQLDRAERAIAAWRDADGTEPAVSVAEARLLIERGQPRAGEAQLLRLVGAYPRQQAVYEPLFDFYLQQGEQRKFLQLFQRLGQALAGHTYARRMQGELAMLVGRADEARQLLEPIVTTDPRNREALEALVIACIRADQPDAARQLLAGLLERDPELLAAITWLDYLAANPAQRQAVDKRRLAYLELQEPSVSMLLQRIGALRRLDRADEALALFDQPALAEADRVEVEGSRGLVLVALDRVDQAVARFDRLIAEASDEQQTRLLAAKTLVLMDAQRWADAADATRQLIERDPDRATSHRMTLVDLLVRQEEPEAAIELLEEVADDLPGGPAEAYYRQAQIAANRMDDAQRAEKLLLKTLEADPEHAPASNDLGYTWAEQGRNLARAERLIRQAVRVNPRHGSYIDSLGWVLYKRGRFDEAAAHLQRAVRMIGGQHPVVQDHLADALWRLGRTDAAVETWRQARDVIVEAGDDADTQMKQLLPLIRGKLKAVERGDRPEVAPIAEGAADDPSPLTPAPVGVQ